MTMPPRVSVHRPVELTWYGCDLRTGRITEELQALSTSQPLTRKLGASTTASMQLALDGAPGDWEAATQPGRTMLVATDRATDQPIGAWLTLTRAGGTAPLLDLGGATPEAYFDRRYAAPYSGFGVDQAAILTTTGAPLLTDAPPFVFDAPATGTKSSYSVADGDDRTILSVWQELTAGGGPEWTVDVAWTADRSGFVLPIRVRSQIGAVTTAPDPVFDMPGCISSYTLTESYEEGKGATRVRAYGDGEGASRLQSDLLTADDLLAAGYCLWEHRYTPADGLTDPAQLTAHAREDLAAMRTGGAVWTVDAVASRAPRLGRDFGLGDSVRVQVTHSPRHPQGASTVARCWSWQLDPSADTVSPILVEDD
ncbi:hypothetical protein ABTZ57_01490 [Streptomyces sp. NPDC094048]|uniref:hypothetical protein n=1 Tax=unclassified Streptomyces TaxID=2593676 RepID=UPI00332413E5